MKTILTVLWLWCAVVVGAYGQAVPLMLRVTKNQTAETKDRMHTGYYSRSTTAETLSYTIEVTNAGQSQLTGVEVRWAILLKPRGNAKPKLAKGTKTLTLARSEKQTVETDPVQIRESWRSSYSTYNYDMLEEVGHSIEVIVDGKTVASEIKPMDAKQKIEVARRSAEPPPAPAPDPSRPARKTKKTKT
jgi:hypothetical protein